MELHTYIWVLSLANFVTWVDYSDFQRLPVQWWCSYLTEARGDVCSVNTQTGTQEVWILALKSFVKIVIVRWMKKNKQTRKQPKLCKYSWIFCHCHLLSRWRNGFLNNIIKALHECFKMTLSCRDFQTKGDSSTVDPHVAIAELP